jgi:hypothetical protein
LPLNRWSGEYYKEEMQRLFDVMRGEKCIGIEWGGEPLTIRQAAEVVQLFEVYLDTHDRSLELLEGETELRDTDEYYWCDKRGAIPIEEMHDDEEA